MTIRLMTTTALVAFATVAALPAMAADMRPIAPLPTLADGGTRWDGFYAGLHWGYGQGVSKWRNPLGYYALAPTDVPAHGYSDGLIAGLQAGYNAQVGALVIGTEIDFNAGSLLGNAACGATVGVGGSGDVCSTRTDMMGSLNSRFGFALGRALIYAKAGAAFSRDQAKISNEVLAGIPTVSETGVRYGWTVGAGLAYAIDSTWSAFADYGYYSFNRHTYRFTAPDGAINVGHAQHLLRFGLNYRFGDGLGYNPASVAVPEVVNDVTGEFGTRVGYSTGKFRKRLYDNVTPGQLNSVLTWPTRNDAAVEAFARVDHSSGLFLRGTIGGLDLGRSRMHDEDTAVVMAPFPYSDTVSQMKNGRAFSATVDLGYTAVKTSLVTLGAFAGYGFYAQRLNGYGCEQVAGSIVCAPAGTVSPTALTLSETERWSMLRLGLAGSLMITDKLKLTAEGAWLGRATLAAKDNHWLRPNINPLIESGRQGGKGFETEVGLSYALGPRWSVGAGVRYMMLKANGGVTFPGSPTLSPEKFETRRMTTFFQASYRFGDQTTPAPAAVVARY